MYSTDLHIEKYNIRYRYDCAMRVIEIIISNFQLHWTVLIEL